MRVLIMTFCLVFLDPLDLLGNPCHHIARDDIK